MALHAFFFSTLMLVPLGDTDSVVFRVDFHESSALDGWARADGELVPGYGGTSSLLVENSKADASRFCQIAIPAEAIVGRLIIIEATVKAEGLRERPNSWNGVKVMLTLQTENGGREYPQIELPGEDFDWQTGQRMVRVPRDLKTATLSLGLEKVSGKAWFDNVEIRLPRRASGGKRSEAPFKGHDEPRLRGVMHGPAFNEENLRYLAEEWGANQVRWQLNWTPMKEAEDWAQDLERFDEWLKWAVAEADKAVDACEKYGLHMLLDLHTPPGGRKERGVCRMFSEQRYQDKLVEVWQRLATRYKGRDIIYAYDLLNEPVEETVAPGLLNWRDLATRVTKAIRAIDPGKPVVFEPGPWGNPDGFDLALPLDVHRVIYSFHMYKPHAFTHQGVRGSKVGFVYPGPIGSGTWDKERLRETMMPVVDFQREFNVHIYVGEFSAIRWAPDNSAYRYLRDLIDLFEEYGWDWSYHAYREWEGWSVEHGTVREKRERSATPTDREKLLRSWFQRNQEGARN
jgi:hypothetical protein